jgi:enhancer of polycomb-like protein
MASQRLAGQRFRQRKLSVKHPLAILREHEVELTFDDEAQRNMPKFETGVEKAEEIVRLITFALFTSSAPIIT